MSEWANNVQFQWKQNKTNKSKRKTKNKAKQNKIEAKQKCLKQVLRCTGGQRL